MEHIDVDARYFKKQYDEIGEPPKPGDNWWLDNNTGVATVAAVEPLRADIYNFSESSKITMYDFYKIIKEIEEAGGTSKVLASFKERFAPLCCN